MVDLIEVHVYGITRLYFYIMVLEHTHTAAVTVLKWENTVLFFNVWNKRRIKQ